MANIKEYTVQEYVDVFEYGMEPDEAVEEFASRIHGAAIVIYADEESAIAGCKYEDGTFGIFGTGMDEDDLTEEEMYTGINAGY